MDVFAEFRPYELTGVKVTGQKLGRGSYATVYELEYRGLKCAGKKIHGDLLWREDEESIHSVRRFLEECRLLSQVRHPNIVQFLGVYFEKDQAQVPILVMEFLPTSLTVCIEKRGILPMETSCTILHDVALGLYYLHKQEEPIVHQDLSSNNVLLTTNMRGKISDLGLASTLKIPSHTTGIRMYMPPEMMIGEPKCHPSIDVFSYGILMIHVFSGRWPEPQVGPTRFDFKANTVIPVSEADRRRVFLDSIGYKHPLIDLAERCIKNNPQLRPCIEEIVTELADLSKQPDLLMKPQTQSVPHRKGTIVTAIGEQITGVRMCNEVSFS